MIIAYITCKDKAEAKKIAKKLVSERLIGCANIFPVKSVYRWEGKVAEENEYAIICKSAESKFNSIKKSVKEMHSYKVPCIIKINAEADEGYAEWVEGEVR